MPAKPKICNQYTGPTDKGILTIRCRACGETTRFRLPIPIRELDRQGTAFISLHTAKGCNKEQLP